jgi:NitT/TauT family transport system substrate-binding protein
MKFRIAALGVGLAAAVALTAPALAQTKLAVTQYGRITQSLPWAVAFEKGWLKENGLNVESIISSDGGGTSVRNMLASDLPFGEVAVAAAVAANLKMKLDIQIVYGGADTIGELSWLSHPDTGVKKIEDLRGKTVAFTSPQSATEMALRLVLDKSGIPTTALKMIAGGNLAAVVTAINQRGVDAGPVSDPALAQSEGKLHSVFAVSDLFPHYMWNVGVTTKAFAQKNPQMVRALIQARRKAVQFIFANPGEAAAIYAKVWELDKEQANVMLKRALRFQYWSEGDFNKEGIDVALKGMLLAGLIDGPFDINTMIDQNYLPEDLRRKL